MARSFETVLVIIALMFPVSSSKGAEREIATAREDGLVRETFAGDLGEFDTEVNNRTGGNDWGWANSNNAGGKAGELAGREKRSADDYVCDATLGGSLTEKNTIIIRGKGWIQDINADENLLVGYKSLGSRDSKMGIVIGEPKSDTSGKFSMTLVAGGGESDMYWPVPDNTPFEFDLSYDPNTQVFSGTINGQFATTADNGTVGTFSVDAFGVFDIAKFARPHYFNFAFDDFEYTVVGPSISFESACSEALEAVSSVELTVIIKNSGPGRTYSVDYAVAGGTAKAKGVDYTLEWGTLTFEPGQVSKKITIDIINDGLDEDNETIVVELSNPKGMYMEPDSITSHTYTIIDPRPYVRFDTDWSCGKENISPATVVVTLTDEYNKTVTVDYAASPGGTATGGSVDYNLTAGTLTFAPGDTSDKINIDIIDDAVNEGYETINIRLSNPINAREGEILEYTYGIIDKSETAWDKEYTNSLGMKLVRIRPGSFMMGFGEEQLTDEVITKEKGDKPQEFLRNGNFDEHPAHKVTITKPFYFGMYEVTNAQYEQFDPGHRQLRGTMNYSKGDDDAVIMVSWDQAVEFCKWLSNKEQRTYRLPTEAEWEHACRAGTKTAFYTGATLASEPIPANRWGLYNIHGNVEEWCYDWYGPYAEAAQIDPVGRIDGDYKVTRGGSHSTNIFYLRSANRGGTIKNDRSWLVGFRVVLGEMPTTKQLPVVMQQYQKDVLQKIPEDLDKGPDPEAPYFKIRTYINIPKDARGPLHYYHNHNPDIVQCPNGDLLSIFFSTQSEGDREMVYGASRLRYGNDKWDNGSVFWAPPDRKSEYSVLWVDKGIIYNFSLLGVAGSRPGAIIMRTSVDNCVTWSKARVIAERADDQGVMETVFRTSKGAIVIPADDHNLFVSYDNGKTWSSPCNAKGPAGIHTPMIELKNGSLMSFGRYDDIDGKMPKSVSSDMGKTWKVSASIFPGIGGGLRATMLRLKEGPILFASSVN
ncbi:MAG: SUMF1/EgtB/PvdO family nonheme iron enzyme [Planctomycetota bacterium]|jgi:formylglycine-generating enzyme required for sulfatase activity